MVLVETRGGLQGGGLGIPSLWQRPRLLVSSSGQRALAPGRCTDGKVPRSGHSWVEIRFIGGKDKVTAQLE